MEPLATLLQLLKHNILLGTIVATGSVQGVDLGQIKHRIHSAQAIEFYDFDMGAGKIFPNIQVLIVDSSTSITFLTPDSRYFDNSVAQLQGRDLMSNAKQVELQGSLVPSAKRKWIGDYTIFPAPVPYASVWVRNSSIYGYAISIQFIKRTDTYEHTVAE